MTINNLCRCDVCGASVEAERERQYALPDGWGNISITVCVNDSVDTASHYDVCTSCMARIGTALDSAGLTAEKAQIQNRRHGKQAALEAMLGLK